MLEQLRVSYLEVLAATKHEDDKVGRFLATIAFIVAGALLFVDPAVLGARYDLGGTEVALPAFALVGFLITILLAVLLYVLSTAAPVIVPPQTRPSRDPATSLLFFLQIAKESEASWRRRWLDGDEAPCAVGDLRSRLIENYIDETYNLAVRADSKRNRSVEASVLFSAALLFFGLLVGWSIHVYQSAEPWADRAFLPLEAALQWTTPVRGGTAVALVLFALMMLYLQLRRQQSRNPARRTAATWWAMAGVSGFIVAASLPIPAALGQRRALAAATLLFAVVAGAAFARPRPAERWTALAVLQGVVAVAAGAAAVWAVMAGAAEWLLLLSIIASLSPLSPTLITALAERRRRVVERAQRHALHGVPRLRNPEG